MAAASVAPATYAVKGRLVFTVVKAKDLKNLNLLGTMDPFAQVEFKSEKFKTKVHKDGGMTPSWSQAFIFNVDGKSNDLFFVDVMNEKTIGSERIGRATCSLHDCLLAVDTNSKVFDLRDADNFTKMAGRLELKFEWQGTPDLAHVPGRTQTTTTTAPIVQAVAAPVQQVVQPPVTIQPQQPVYAPQPISPVHQQQPQQQQVYQQQPQQNPMYQSNPVYPQIVNQPPNYSTGGYHPQQQQQQPVMYQQPMMQQPMMQQPMMQQPVMYAQPGVMYAQPGVVMQPVVMQQPHVVSQPVQYGAGMYIKYN